MRAKIKEKYHKFTDKLKGKPKSFIGVQSPARQHYENVLSPRAPVRPYVVEQKQVTFREVSQPPLINLQLVNDYNEQASSKELGVYTIVNSIGKSGLTPVTKRNRQHLIMLQNPAMSPFRRASKYESLLLQSHRLDTIPKLTIQIQELEATLQDMKWIYESKQEEQYMLQHQLYILMQAPPVTPGTPYLCRRTSDVNIYNYDQEPILDYYSMLIKEVPRLELELVHLKQVAEHLSTQINTETASLIEMHQSELQDLLPQKRLLKQYCEQTRRQTQEIVEKTNYMVLEVGYFGNEEIVESTLSESKVPTLEVPVRQLQRINDQMNCFLVNVQARGENLLQVSDQFQEEVTYLQVPMRSPMMGSPLLGSPARIQGLKESILLLDLETEKTEMVQSYQNKQRSLESNYRQQMRELQAQKERLTEEQLELRSFKLPEDNLTEIQQTILAKKNKLMETVKYEDRLRIEVRILEEKVAWMQTIRRR